MVAPDRLSGGPRIAAVHPTGATLRVVGSRPFAGPVTLERVGAELRAHAGPGPGEPIGGVDVERVIDRPSLAIGGVDVDIVEVLREVFEAGLGAAGAEMPPDILAIVRPPQWGAPRTRRLERAGREIADDVVLFDAASLAAEVADATMAHGPAVSSRPPADRTIVVACARDRWVVTAVRAAADGYRSIADRVVRLTSPDPPTATQPSDRRLLPTQPAATDVDALVEVIDELLGPDVDPIDCVRRVVLHAADDAAVPVDRIARAIVVPRERPWAEPLLTQVVAVDALVETAYDRIARSVVSTAPPARQPARPPASWLDDNRRRPSGGGGRRWWPAVAAVAVLFVVAGVVGWSGRGSGSVPVESTTPIAAEMAAAGSGAPGPTPLAPPGVSAATTTAATATTTATTTAATTPAEAGPRTIELGRVAVEIPDGWRVDESSDRIALLPQNPDVAQRILVQAVSVLPDTDIALLERRLREQASGPDPGVPAAAFADFVAADHDELAYLERPIDGSVVRWRALLRSELQISIGCQYLPSGSDLGVDGPPADLARACDRVVASMTVRDP
ncbi:type VII secretion-associated protein [Millisia brevis]|uniref:type VII secretion-associated protein n=1 Tax=Millisia brevis TaxID=264148 RepID=UPI0008324828|nr:type VII secretion-associated protein [Millisia brevis]